MSASPPLLFGRDAPGSPGPLVWLGTPFWRTPLESWGHSAPHQPYDTGRAFTWEDILEITGGRTPGLVLASDASTPPLLLGMERFPCLTALYCIDSHVHSWQPRYAQGFDLCLVSLRDHLPRFQAGRLRPERVLWSPPFAFDELDAPETPPDPEWDLLFVGTVDPQFTPARHAFFQRLKERLPAFSVSTARRSYWDLYPRARLALNESSAGDLNFRVFEVLACGVCLLTPLVGHGLTDMFSPGEELFTYPPGDVEALASLAESLLADPEARRRAAAAGHAKVMAAHRARHRAAAFLAVLERLFASGEAERIVNSRLAEADAIRGRFLRLLYLHHAEAVGIPELSRQYLAAARAVPA